MMKEPTMEEVLELVEFGRDNEGDLVIKNINGEILGDVWGHVWGDVRGHVWGSVRGSVEGNVEGCVWGNVMNSVQGSVWGTVKGTISHRKWQFVETPLDKAIRLMREGKGEEAIKVLEEIEE